MDGYLTGSAFSGDGVSNFCEDECKTPVNQGKGLAHRLRNPRLLSHIQMPIDVTRVGR
jgi:hypothetical protein